MFAMAALIHRVDVVDIMASVNHTTEKYKNIKMNKRFYIDNPTTWVYFYFDASIFHGGTLSCYAPSLPQPLDICFFLYLLSNNLVAWNPASSTLKIWGRPVF
jgi:hypothetical protein